MHYSSTIYYQPDTKRSHSHFSPSLSEWRPSWEIAFNEQDQELQSILFTPFGCSQSTLADNDEEMELEIAAYAKIHNWYADKEQAILIANEYCKRRSSPEAALLRKFRYIYKRTAHTLLGLGKGQIANMQLTRYTFGYDPIPIELVARAIQIFESIEQILPEERN